MPLYDKNVKIYPPTTIENTIIPGATGIVPLTINGFDTTSHLLDVAGSDGASSFVNGTSDIFMSDGVFNFPVSFNPSKSHTLYDDFTSAIVGSTIQSTANWNFTFAGTAANVTVATGAPQDQTHWGAMTFTTGTTNSGRAEMSMGSGTVMELGNSNILYEFLVNIITLSDGTQTWKMRIGLGDTGGTADMANGVYFIYDSTTSANWIRATATASTRTETASSTAVTTGWNKLRCIVNTAASTCDFYVNGVSIGSNTTNIPTAAFIAPRINVFKTVGNTARLVHCDYFFMTASLGTAR